MAYKKKLTELMKEIEAQKAHAAHLRRASKHMHDHAARRNLLGNAERIESDVQRLEAQAAILKKAPPMARKYLVAAVQSFRRIAGSTPEKLTRGGTLTDYRLHLVDEAGAIQAREEFIAPNDDVALIVANMVYRACSDTCHSYELWQVDRRVIAFDGSRETIVVAPTDQQTVDIQQITLNLEDILQRSHWHIARSATLMAETERLRERMRLSG